MTPQEAVMQALNNDDVWRMFDPGDYDECPHVDVDAFISALPPGAAIVTVDSLEEAMWDALDDIGHMDVDGSERGDGYGQSVIYQFASAIIKALKP